MGKCRFLFWNVKRRDLTEQVCALASDTKADGIFLCEAAGVDASDLLSTLKERVDPQFHIPNATPASNARFLCFCRESHWDLSELSSEARVSVRKWRLGAHTALVALIHGVDKRNNDLPYQQASAQSLVTRIREIAEEQGIHKLLWLGDFNLNPFDPPMAMPQGFNAMMTKQCAMRGSRTVESVPYDFYYNPMWGHLGDRNDGPSGTYYHTGRSNFGWNMLDQVLVHPQLLPFFHDVEILTMAGAATLVDSSGRPNAQNTPSDHLPILVTFFEGDSDD